ncbi:unnamed protein product [Rotaria sp. Silwood2]|nr:unnamed protein product [Rotaria sp. Silwood2]
MARYSDCLAIQSALSKTRGNSIADTSLEDHESKDQIVSDLLESGRQSLVKYQKDIIYEIYTHVMDGNENKLIILLKMYFQQKWETEYGASSNQWFISFIKKYQNGENHNIYERILTRTAEYGNTYMKNYPILSIILQLLFEFIDDKYLKETNIFDDLWFTITIDGLKSITKYSDYIIEDVMNEQLNKSQSTLFQALREYYRQAVFLKLQQSYILDEQNLYDLVLDNVTEHGWLVGLQEIRNKIPWKSYNRLLENVSCFLK